MASSSTPIGNGNQKREDFLAQQKKELDNLYKEEGILMKVINVAMANHDNVKDIINNLQEGLRPGTIEATIRNLQNVNNNLATQIIESIQSITSLQEKIDKVLQTIDKESDI